MPDIEVRASRVEGLGIFATRPFQAGERIAQLKVVREITPEEPIRGDVGERSDHCSYPDGRTVLVAFPERHVNHSCDPNAFEQFEGAVSYLVARRAIPKDEEVTIDYNINITNGTAWPCHCGAKRCRAETRRRFLPLATRLAARVPPIAGRLVCAAEPRSHRSA